MNSFKVKEPFLDGSKGQWMTKPDEVEKIMSIYWKEGFQIHCHINGDEALQLILDNVKKLQKLFPR